MSVFLRRFSFDPGNVVLLNIESVNVLDLAPPSQIIGVGSGTCLLVGEFENGPFNSPTQIFSPQDVVSTFGSLGYTYQGIVGQNPCARQRKADGALVPEYWNGNGFVQLNAKTFSALILCRANTSVGNVTFTRQAFLTGLAGFSYALQTGQVLQLDVGSGPTSATFTGLAATVTGSGATFGSITAGMTAVFAYDSAAQFTVTFQAGDTTVGAAVARINQYAGFSFASNAGGQIALTGIQGGLGGLVNVVSGSAGTLTDLGLTTGVTLGTGNVVNIAAVKPTEVATIVQAAISGTTVVQDQNSAIRIAANTNPYIVVGAGTTATGLGFVPGTEATTNGQPILVSGAGTYNLGTTGTITIQLDNTLAPVTTTVSSGATLAATVSALNAAFTAAGQGTPVTSDGATRFYVVGPNPGGTITVVGASAGGVLTELGLAVGSTAGLLPPFGLLPAGTVVQVPGSTAFVTMQDLDWELAGVSLAGVLLPKASSYSVPIRFALDDGSGVGVSTGTITQVTLPPAIGAFSVINQQAVSNALTEAQIDAQYSTAIACTVSTQSVASQTNIMWSARQSNAVRSALANNAQTASQGGCLGRTVVVRTPMNLPEATALSQTAAPGVGAYYSSNPRTVYCYPQVSTNVPLIAFVGTAGGTGFNATGNVDVGADGFLASILSQLPPEEDPGQATTFTGGVIGLESGANIQSANGGQGFLINDYIAFKAAGICAARMDSGNLIFQSGVLACNPLLYPNLVSIARRRMADFIEDSISIAMKSFGKQLQKNKRRKAMKGEIATFLNGLAGGGPGAATGNPNDEDSQRIAGYNVDDSRNTPQTIAANLWRIIIAVQTLSEFGSIVLQTTVGTTVNVTDISPAT